MKKHLIDIHCHTAETSNCGQTPADETVRLYNSLGYSGIMVSDHLHNYTFRTLKKTVPNPTWEEKMEYFLKGYKAALKEAENFEGFKVYLGCELRFDENDNDYLVFGLTEEKLRKMEGVVEMDTEDGIKFVKSLGCAVIQAHPFRKNCVVVKPGIYDGVEVYNGHKGHESNNDIALMWAKKYNYVMTSGTDFHGEHDPNSGIYVDEMPEDEDALRDLILSQNFELKTNGELDI